MIDKLVQFWQSTGFACATPGQVLMIAVSLFLIYLAIVKKYEPLLLLPISFGMLLANIPGANLMAGPEGGQPGGLLYYLYLGVKNGIYPPLIFLGVGASTDFGPLIANPKTL
ncbi:MAG TPA: glutaconyl-CoA decarboxylase subunit beta, partial [Firmicutes bacterium]|nr:glutaconyl-CoA decarboxylase subunit beta [Bacillota bacterium]